MSGKGFEQVNSDNGSPPLISTERCDSCWYNWRVVVRHFDGHVLSSWGYTYKDDAEKGEAELRKMLASLKDGNVARALAVWKGRQYARKALG